MSTDIEIKLDEKIEEQITEPLKYNVIFLNDDQTPMEWVYKVLTEIFKHSRESAESITMTIHNEGSGVVGTYLFEIAEQKAIETVNLSRTNGFPLQVTVEAE